MKLFKNRLFVAGMVLLLAVGSFFAYNTIQEKQYEKISVISVASPIRKGDMIEASDLTTTEVVKYNLSAELITSPLAAEGKFAMADFMPGDFILQGKVSDTLARTEEKLLKLDGKRLAMSISIKNFAKGLSDKIVGGDIVSCLITKDEEETQIPMELKYIEVVTTTMPSGADKENSADVTEENLATATLLVTPEQAILLAGYDETATIHLALVYRGDYESTQKFLETQAQINDAPGAVPDDSELLEDEE